MDPKTFTRVARFSLNQNKLMKNARAVITLLSIGTPESGTVSDTVNVTLKNINCMYNIVNTNFKCKTKITKRKRFSRWKLKTWVAWKRVGSDSYWTGEPKFCYATQDLQVYPNFKKVDSACQLSIWHTRIWRCWRVTLKQRSKLSRLEVMIAWLDFRQTQFWIPWYLLTKSVRNRICLENWPVTQIIKCKY